VLVVDEAGMVGTRDLAELAEKAAESWCKLVLVGDDRQLPEIEAGGSFRALARDDSTELSVLRRQRDREEREALAALREGQTKEWARFLADRDRLGTADTAELLRDQMTADWHAARREGHDRAIPSSGRSWRWRMRSTPTW
jgi:ATP-dependent exoDNAse (exonuclease V) alpha subunit